MQKTRCKEIQGCSDDSIESDAQTHKSDETLEKDVASSFCQSDTCDYPDFNHETFDSDETFDPDERSEPEWEVHCNINIAILEFSNIKNLLVQYKLE